MPASTSTCLKLITRPRVLLLLALVIPATLNGVQTAHAQDGLRDLAGGLLSEFRDRAARRRELAREGASRFLGELLGTPQPYPQPQPYQPYPPQPQPYQPYPPQPQPYHPYPPQPYPQPQANNTARIEQLVLTYINQYRASRGAGPLSDHGTLTAMARQHSQSMAARSSVDHQGDQQRFQSMFQMGAMQVAENVANAFQGTDEQIARQAVTMWINSPGHNQNLSNPRVTLSGVGIAQNGNRFYLTQLFAGQ